MFDLKEFKSKIYAPQRSNKYSVFLYGRSGLEDIHLLAEEVTFPTFGYDKTTSTYRYGFGVRDEFPGTPEYKDLIVTFIMQQGSIEHALFHDWFDDIIRKDPVESGGVHTYDTTSFTFKYKDDYTSQLEIKLHGEAASEDEAKWEFQDVFPTSITGDPLSWEQADTYLTYAVTFKFYAMKFIPGTLPVPYANAPAKVDKGALEQTQTPPFDSSIEGYTDPFRPRFNEPLI